MATTINQPGASVAATILRNSVTFSGALHTAGMPMKNSSVFWFDGRIKAVIMDDVAAVFETERWWESRRSMAR
jgi:hypothetical protein